MTPAEPFFPCRHPILCAAMNQVSDVGLAVAVHRAGAFPSLSIPNYVQGDRFDRDRYQGDLRAFQDATGSRQLLLSVGSSLLLQDAVMRPFLELGYRHVELFHWRAGDADWPAVLERSRRLAGEQGVKFVFKISTGHVAAGLDYPTLLLKGPEGAGRSADDAPPLDEAFAFCRRQLPATGLIVSGGIHSAAQVKDYVERGALAVAIGSLFAAARESKVADSVKQKLIAADSAQLQTVGAGRLKGLYNQVLPGDNRNLTRTLAAGIRDADAGGIFVGSAIDHITELLSVQQIVDRLVSTG